MCKIIRSNNGERVTLKMIQHDFDYELKHDDENAKWSMKLLKDQNYNEVMLSVFKQ
jgi:predicted hydrolase (HD superfamily)